MRSGTNKINKNKHSWEAGEGFLEFLSDVRGELALAAEELGAEFRLEVAPPESIDGDRNAPSDLSFFICLRKSGFPALSYCLYARLEPRALRAFAGQYETGRVSTIRELQSLQDPDGARDALKGWLRELFWLSLGKEAENA